jgi:hypothetical protein
MILVDSFKIIIICNFLSLAMEHVILEASDVAHRLRMKLTLIIISLIINHISVIIRAIAKDVISKAIDRAIIELTNQDISILLS